MAHSVQIQNDFAGMLGQAAHSQLQQAVLQGLRPMTDFVAAGLFVIAQFHPVQGAGRGQRFALLVGAALLGQRIGLAGRYGQQRVTAQEVMVVDVLLAQGQAVNALGHQLFERMVHEDLMYFPLPLAAALGLGAGERVQWELLDRGELHLVRLEPPAPSTTQRHTDR